MTTVAMRTPFRAREVTAATFMKLPHAARIRAIKALSDEECAALMYDWDFWARPEQKLPEADWSFWLALAGRGWGKTRVGAETVRIWVRQGFQYVNLIGATSDDARDIMIEGESGIMAICPPHERPEYVPSKRRLVWPNGARSTIFTADEPERLRGKQHQKLWADEIASWRYPAAWDQARFGLRLGPSPQGIVTTTPRPTKLVKELIQDPNTYVTHGTTYDNRANLAKEFYAHIIKKYEGTRLGRQELKAEVLNDNPHALWKRSDIEDTRRTIAPPLKRIVVAIDPATTSKSTSNEAGIIAAGLGTDDRGYVLDDRTLRGTPETWARAAVNLLHALKGDRIVAEVNNGGELVEFVVRTVDKNVPYKCVHASRGKKTRAEPVSALYEQKRVSHVGFFPELEDELCEWDPINDTESPNRLDALVWAITELMLGEEGTAWDVY